MSDLKNVLKAGFLVTASLLATGCDDNKDKAATPSTPNNGGGSGGGNGSGGGSGGGGSSPSPQSPTVNKPIPTFKIDTANVLKSLKEGAASYTVVGLDEFKPGASEEFKFFDHFKIEQAQKLGTTPNSSNITETTIVNIAGLQTNGKDSILFEASNKKLTSGKLGGLFLEGFLEKDKPRKILTNKFKGAFTVDAFVLRNALAQGVGERASISSIYGYVGIDAAVGYPFLRENSKGEKVEVPDHVFSTPDTKPVQQLGLGMALHSKSKKQSKVEDPKRDKDKANENVLGQKKSDDTIKLVVGSNKSLDQIKRKNLEDAGLDLGKQDGALDIGGRVSNLETINAIVLPISDIQPTLVHIKGVQTKEVDTPIPEKQVTRLGFGNPFKSKTKPKAQVDAKQAVEKSNKTAATPSIGQAIVKDSSGVQKFMFQIKEGDCFPEIGDWKVKAGSQLGILPHHSLVVHYLDLTDASLGLHVYADKHTFVKAQQEVNLTLNDQELFKHLAIKHGLPTIETSPEVEESSGEVVSNYAHFSSHTPFPLWVMDANVATQSNTLKLEDITLADDFNLEKGYYVMPLAKDFKKKITDTGNNTPIAIGESKYEVTGWKVAGNGYFDKVLLIQVEEKAQRSPSGLGLSSVLMSSKAQGRRSVASSKLDAVIAKLDPSNLVSASLANIASTHANQASQFATMARGSNAATSAKLGAVEQYAVSFNHEGVQFGLTYNLNGGNAFTSNSGTTAIGANVATNVLGLKAIVSAEASVDAGKNALVSTSVTSYSAGLTFAKAYNAAGLSVVPMAGFGVSSNAFSGYSAIVPMAYNALGLSMNNVSFSTATFHAGVNLALDDFVAKASGVNASLTLGVAGYLAANANAKLSTNEGASKHIAFEGSSATPYAQFNLGFATGETLNALISTGSVAVNFGFDR